MGESLCIIGDIDELGKWSWVNGPILNVIWNGHKDIFGFATHWLLRINCNFEIIFGWAQFLNRNFHINTYWWKMDRPNNGKDSLNQLTFFVASLTAVSHSSKDVTTHTLPSRTKCFAFTAKSVEHFTVTIWTYADRGNNPALVRWSFAPSFCCGRKMQQTQRRPWAA